MRHRLASARVGMTQADFAFIEALLTAGNESAVLAKLWDDPEAFTAILDLKELHRGLLESPVALPDLGFTRASPAVPITMPRDAPGFRAPHATCMACCRKHCRSPVSR